MKLYVLRHGETDTNAFKMICGKRECDLTKDGINQAREVKKKLAGINFDAVISSPLTRARVTASIISDKPVIIDKRLTERDYGAYELKRKVDIDYNGFWNYSKKQTTGESVKALLNRMGIFLKDLIKKYPNKTVLLVTHSGVARGIHYYLTGIPRDNDLTKLEIPNCSFRVYEIKEENYENIIN